MVYKIKIVSHQIKDDKVVYTIQVSQDSLGLTKTFKYRYSQLKDIHTQLEKLINKLKLNLILPQFPGRKLFGTTNKSQQAVLQRKKQLANYLNELIFLQKLFTLDIFKEAYLPDKQKNEQSQPVFTKQKLGEINIQICIDRYTLVEDVVIYYVRMRDLNTHQQWTFKTRYSDLRNIHEALEQSKIRFLPIFPKRKIFGITNDSPQDIQKRRQQLQRYFNEIFLTKQLVNTEVIRFFIEDSKKQAEREKQIQKSRKQKKEKKEEKKEEEKLA